MMPLLLFGLYCLALFFLYSLAQSLRHAYNARKWHCKAPPRYPSDIFGINTVQEILRADRENEFPQVDVRRTAKMYAREHRQVTTFQVRQMGHDTISTSDPKNIQAVLATQFKDFGVGEVRRMLVVELAGEGLIASDGHTWARSRALVRPLFSRPRISDLELEERHVQVAMRALAPIDVQTGWSPPVDIHTVFLRLTMDSASEFFLGNSMNTQTAALEGKPTEEFAVHFDRAQQLAMKRGRYGKLGRFIDAKQFHAANTFVKEYINQIIDAALARSKEKKEQDDDFHRLDFLRSIADQTQNLDELRSTLLAMLFGGRDTTAALLSFTVLTLAQHPAVFAKLRCAVLDAFGPYPVLDRITFASLKACRYLQYVLNEVMRLYPLTPVNQRVAMRDTTLPCGGGQDGMAPVYIRKDQPVQFSVYVMHRRKDLWGPDAEDFVPERWEGRKYGWHYLPFGGGPRVCVGQQFALTEAAYVLVRLLQRFDQLEGVGMDDDRVEITTGFAISPTKNVVVRVHEA